MGWQGGEKLVGYLNNHINAPPSLSPLYFNSIITAEVRGNGMGRT